MGHIRSSTVQVRPNRVRKKFGMYKSKFYQNKVRLPYLLPIPYFFGLGLDGIRGGGTYNIGGAMAPQNYWKPL